MPTRTAEIRVAPRFSMREAGRALGVSHTTISTAARFLDRSGRSRGPLTWDELAAIARRLGVEVVLDVRG